MSLRNASTLGLLAALAACSSLGPLELSGDPAALPRDAAGLLAYRAVILENVPASAIGLEPLTALTLGAALAVVVSVAVGRRAGVSRPAQTDS